MLHLCFSSIKSPLGSYYMTTYDLPCSFVTVNVEFPDSNTLMTGDVHDKPVPAAAAAKHTANNINNSKMIIAGII